MTITEDRRKKILAGDMLLAVLDWVLHEQLAGRSPASPDVAAKFDMSVEEAELVREHLEKIGELD